MKFIIPTKEIEEILHELDRIENLVITTGPVCINKVYDESNPDIISYMPFARLQFYIRKKKLNRKLKKLRPVRLDMNCNDKIR